MGSPVRVDTGRTQPQEVPGVPFGVSRGRVDVDLATVALLAGAIERAPRVGTADEHPPPQALSVLHRGLDLLTRVSRSGQGRDPLDPGYQETGVGRQATRFKTRATCT